MSSIKSFNKLLIPSGKLYCNPPPLCPNQGITVPSFTLGISLTTLYVLGVVVLNASGKAPVGLRLSLSPVVPFLIVNSPFSIHN